MRLVSYRDSIVSQKIRINSKLMLILMVRLRETSLNVEERDS